MQRVQAFRVDNVVGMVEEQVQRGPVGVVDGRAEFVFPAVGFGEGFEPERLGSDVMDKCRPKRLHAAGSGFALEGGQQSVVGVDDSNL